MAERKGINNFLSRLPNPEPEAPEKVLSRPGTGSKPRKSNLFERLNAVSALDAEPDLARIARNVSLFAARPAVRPAPAPDDQASETAETVKKVAPARATPDQGREADCRQSSPCGRTGDGGRPHRTGHASGSRCCRAGNRAYLLLSSEEHAARDAEQEAKAVTAARKQAETACFDAWREALPPDDRDRAITGYPGGPRDTWQRAYWKRQQEAAITAKPEDASGGRGE